VIKRLKSVSNFFTKVFLVSVSTAFLTARKLVAVASHHPTIEGISHGFIHFDQAKYKFLNYQFFNTLTQIDQMLKENHKLLNAFIASMVDCPLRGQPCRGPLETPLDWGFDVFQNRQVKFFFEKELT
jgi:hypothetical protein